jgi:hypothetical protein
MDRNDGLHNGRLREDYGRTVDRSDADHANAAAAIIRVARYTRQMQHYRLQHVVWSVFHIVLLISRF